jgi:hypothetical protein
MRTWKIALVFTVLTAALIVTVVHNRADTARQGVNTARHAEGVSAPAITLPDPKKAESWGPVRTTDW